MNAENVVSSFMLFFVISSEHKLMEWIAMRVGMHWLDTEHRCQG